jgi:hypothetical protein
VLVLPFLVDIVTDMASLYDTIEPWDEYVHAGAGAAVALCVWLLVRPRTSMIVAPALACGAGAITAILWEVAQYLSGLTADYLQTAYADTLSDLACGPGGATAAALTVLIVDAVRFGLR